MSSAEHNPPTVEAHGGDEVSHTGHDNTTQQAGESSQANAAPEAAPVPAPALPPRPANLHAQTLPQPFHNQQHQQPYVPYAMQPGGQQFTYAAPVRPVPKQSSAYILTRLGLTVLSSIWGIIIIPLTSLLLSEGGEVSAVSLYAYAIVAVSIIWNTAELITYCVRLRKEVQRGIHPGAHVGVHLLLWLIGAFAILLTVTVYYGVEYSLARCERGDTDYAYRSYSYCDDYTPSDYYRGTIVPTVRALLAIFALWTINHFVLFVLACVDTHKRNALRPAAFVVPMAAIGGAPTQGMYFPQQVVGEQPMQQPMQYYPYPIMMQPQPAHVQPPAVSNGKQPAQPGQNLAGFYAPAAAAAPPA